MKIPEEKHYIDTVYYKIEQAAKYWFHDGESLTPEERAARKKRTVRAWRNLIIKIGLIAVGLVAFMALSGFLMFIETAFGLPAKLRERK